MARPPHHRRRRAAPAAPTPSADNMDPTPVGHPVFAQPRPTPDPTQFRVNHPSDAAAYKTIDVLNAEHKLGPIPFPMPRGLPEPVLTLEQVMGASGADMVKRVTASGQLVFHSVGDTGSVRGPQDQELVADKMTADFDEEAAMNMPQFFFHLGDVIYNFGEARYYYDQFYEPYRDYPAPIVALAGNHDGMPAPGSNTPTLAAFLENFCAAQFEVMPEAGGLARTAQIQPGVFFTFEAPMLRIIALYSNVLEDPGVIVSPEIGNAQLDFLKAALTRAKGFAGALMIAHHHPIYTVGSKHGWSQEMLAQIDQICVRHESLAARRAFGACAQLPALHPRASGHGDPLHHRRQRRPRRRPSQARARCRRTADGRGERRQNDRHPLHDPVPSPYGAAGGRKGTGHGSARELR